MTEDTNQFIDGKRLHPIWIPYKIFHQLKYILFILIFFRVLGSDSQIVKGFALILISVYLCNIILVYVEWRYFKYYFTNKDLHLQHGRIVARQQIVPLERIHGINQYKPLFHRILGFTSLSLNIATAEDSSTIRLEMLTCSEAERIQSYLSRTESGGRKERELPCEQKESIVKERAEFKQHFNMSMRDIFLFSLTTLEFIVLIPIIHSFYNDMNAFIPVEPFIQSILVFFQESVLLTVLGTMLLIILLLAIGFVSAFLKYRNFIISSDQDRIYIQRGLLDFTEVSIRKNEIHSIELQSGLIQKMLGLVKVKLISTGTGNFLDDSSQKVDMLFPFIAKKRALQTIPEILPNFYIQTKMEKLPRSVLIIKLLRPSYLWICTALVTYFFLPNYFYVSVIVLILVVISRLVDAWTSSYSINESFTQLQRGGLTTKLLITERMKIEEFMVGETRMQDKLGLASLTIFTRSIPITSLTISDLPKSVVARYYRWYMKNGG